MRRRRRSLAQRGATWVGFVAFLALVPAVRAQQPFVTDDAEVTPKGEWHFEYFNEYAALARNVAPDLRQDWNNFVIQYGLLGGLEVNVDFPILAIDRAQSSTLGTAFGLGDLDLAAKYQLVAEDAAGVRPAFTLVGAVEFPTGNKSNQLGSGYRDYVLNTIVQKTFAERTIVHLNLGYQFSGNTLTGAIGIRTPGHILTGGLSAVREVSNRLRLGVDLNGAQIRTAHAVDRQLQLTTGGNYLVGEKTSVDFALLAGWYDSPRIGILLGISFSP